VTTPSEALAEVIFPLLVQRGLFLHEDVAKNKTKLATGAMKPEDWLLAAEKALEKEAPR
jgi:hypothetical protein